MGIEIDDRGTHLALSDQEACLHSLPWSKDREHAYPQGLSDIPQLLRPIGACRVGPLPKLVEFPFKVQTIGRLLFRTLRKGLNYEVDDANTALSEPVIIVKYDQHWEETFRTLRDEIAPFLNGLIVSIEHVGSTAIRGVAAKPIIDMDVVVRSREDIPRVIEKLTTLGYRHLGDLGIAGREAFESPKGKPSHHLYVCNFDSGELRRHLVFRDYLRSHPEAALRYSELKKSLAGRYRNERDAYTEAKKDFVEKILRSAG